jgi:hypothetical protein
MGGAPGGGEMGGMGGMGGFASKFNYADPKISKLVANGLSLILPFMGRVQLYKTSQELPTGYVKRDGVKRVKLWYGPLRVRTQAVSSFQSIQISLR